MKARAYGTSMRTGELDCTVRTQDNKYSNLRRYASAAAAAAALFANNDDC